jgi:hypothetical protein
MRMGLKVALISGLLAGVSGLTAAAGLYVVETPSLVGKTLFDQQLSGHSMVTVKPSAVSDAIDSDGVLSQCLWSVDVAFEGGSVALLPGKMICVGPEHEVLEAIPVGTIESFGHCANAACTEYQIKGDTEIKMTLSEPLEFSIQARNERQ